MIYLDYTREVSFDGCSCQSCINASSENALTQASISDWSIIMPVLICKAIIFLPAGVYEIVFTPPVHCSPHIYIFFVK